ncbi:hypothetical protein [Nocardioides ferulae]|uniref:hypothetical protein n=1 Tax=Nocardioides ferulae TaxID=2340821 RepID=UPI000EAB5053|nr:hypothetical protein [Nocardioides ferulae]
MTVSDPADAHPVSPSPDDDEPARYRRLILFALVVVPLSVTAVIGYRPWSEPQVFGPGGGAVGTPHRLGGRPMHFEVLPLRSSEVVTVRDADPVVVTNTADAEIRLSLCRRTEVDWFVLTRRPLDDLCTYTESVEGRLDLTDKDLRVVLTVDPQQPGRVIVDGVHLDYTRDWRHLWQRGSEATGMTVAVKVR